MKAFLKVFYYFESFYRTCVNGGHRTYRIYRVDYTYFKIRTAQEIEQWGIANKTDADEAFQGSRVGKAVTAFELSCPRRMMDKTKESAHTSRSFKANPEGNHVALHLRRERFL